MATIRYIKEETWLDFSDFSAATKTKALNQKRHFS